MKHKINVAVCITWGNPIDNSKYPEQNIYSSLFALNSFQKVNGLDADIDKYIFADLNLISKETQENLEINNIKLIDLKGAEIQVDELYGNTTKKPRYIGLLYAYLFPQFIDVNKYDSITFIENDLIFLKPFNFPRDKKEVIVHSNHYSDMKNYGDIKNNIMHAKYSKFFTLLDSKLKANKGEMPYVPVSQNIFSLPGGNKSIVFSKTMISLLKEWSRLKIIDLFKNTDLFNYFGVQIRIAVSLSDLEFNQVDDIRYISTVVNQKEKWDSNIHANSHPKEIVISKVCSAQELKNEILSKSKINNYSSLIEYIKYRIKNIEYYEDNIDEMSSTTFGNFKNYFIDLKEKLLERKKNFKEILMNLLENEVIRVATYGTFDLLHSGHENIINKAIAMAGGEFKNVFVFVSSDKWNSVKLKRAHLNERERIDAISRRWPGINVFLEDHESPEESWPEHWDEHGLSMIIMGDDHFENLSYINYKKTPCEKEMNIMFFPRTRGISSTILREKIDNVN